jgi:hypothetical protein
MSSGYIPDKDEPGFDGILRALREALDENSRLREMPAEEVAQHLVEYGHLDREPAPPLVAEALGALEAEERSFEPDDLLSEEGNPT